MQNIDKKISKYFNTYCTDRNYLNVASNSTLWRLSVHWLGLTQGITNFEDSINTYYSDNEFKNLCQKYKGQLMGKCYKPLKESEVPEERKGKVNWDFQNPLPSAILNWEAQKYLSSSSVPAKYKYKAETTAKAPKRKTATKTKKSNTKKIKSALK